jgi:dienelactone hydrolase
MGEKLLGKPMLDRSRVMKVRGLILAVGLWAGGLGTAFSQTLEVIPKRVLVDEPAVIRAKGLTPNEHISIQADLIDGADKPWSSQAEFVADAQGAIDTSLQAPVQGSYDGVSATGLIWSMKPAEKHVAQYQGPRDLGTQLIQFRLIRNGQRVANALVEQLNVADGVQQIKVEGQLHGVLFLPNTKERRPGVLVVGGSEGGVPRQKAAWLASRGYAALALAYFRYEDLPPQLERIPLEYFGRALAWMMQRPEISPDRLAVMGTSRGGELALQLGAMFAEVKAVVAYVPANLRAGGCCRDYRIPPWTWHGVPLAFVFSPTQRRDLAATFPAVIPVEHTHGAILVISGGDDGVWPSTEMSDAVVGRLKQDHFPYPYEHLNYPHAGHRAGRPQIVPTWHGTTRNPTSGREEYLGGKPDGDAQSSLDAIPKVLEFLRTSLTEHSSQN